MSIDTQGLYQLYVFLLRLQDWLQTVTALMQHTWSSLNHLTL